MSHNNYLHHTALKGQFTQITEKVLVACLQYCAKVLGTEKKSKEDFSYRAINNRNLNQIHIWCSDHALPLKRHQFSSVHAHSFSSLSLSLRVIPNWPGDVEIRALLGPYHLLQDSLFLLSLEIVFYDSSCMFGVIVMLQNESRAEQMPLWRYCIMDTNLNIYSTASTFCSVLKINHQIQ